MSAYVLDRFAVLAYLQGEPGTERVREVLEQAQDGEDVLAMSVVSVGEVAYISERGGGREAVDAVLVLLDQLPIEIVDAGLALTLAAARIKAHNAVSYADTFAAALATERAATLLTGDPEFATLSDSVAIEWLRPSR